LPDTLGGYYATFTEYLGFKPDEEEGKLMGLAPYGRHDEEMQRKLGEVLRFDPASGDFSVDPRFRFFGPRSQGQRFTDRLVASFGPPRLRHEPIDDRHRDIAYNVQWRLEQVAVALARQTIAATGIGNLCLSGGVAMNCKMNGLIACLPEVERIFVQPASGDGGVALGAAYLSAAAAGVKRFSRFEHAYWGSSYTDEQIESALMEAKIEYRRSADIVAEAAAHLARGRIVGWFQGAAEVGARALGNRSILANPLVPEMRDRLNREVKHREGWRPFCPSVSEEQYARYFPGVPESDFMILAFPVAKEYRAAIPGAVHVDGTARPQRVTRRANARFHALLQAFGRASGHEILINTSFNIQGEPIVNSPRDAVRCFGGTGIDVLAIGDFIAVKPGVLPS
jgi:carbamoyltransferase